MRLYEFKPDNFRSSLLGDVDQEPNKTDGTSVGSDKRTPAATDSTPAQKEPVLHGLEAYIRRATPPELSNGEREQAVNWLRKNIRTAQDQCPQPCYP